MPVRIAVIFKRGDEGVGEQAAGEILRVRYKTTCGVIWSGVVIVSRRTHRAMVTRGVIWSGVYKGACKL
jgi:hypothetical protein